MRANGLIGQQRVAPLLKWPGGKTAELATIQAAMPGSFERYFEPFVGGGAVWLSVPSATPAYVNDRCADLIDFYADVRDRTSQLLACLGAIVDWWEALAAVCERHAGPLRAAYGSGSRDLHRVAVAVLDRTAPGIDGAVPGFLSPWRHVFTTHLERSLPRKLQRMREVERHREALSPVDVAANIEGAFKAACYTTVRRAYNDLRRAGEAGARRSALFYFLREHAYAAMFRFNSRGEFNVPYGGVSYNRKDLRGKLAHLAGAPVQDRLRSTTLGRSDFAAFLEEHRPGPDDFMFLDPPYDSDFSAYDDHTFDVDAHRRLAALMRRLPCGFLLVIKATPRVERIYEHRGWTRQPFAKTYQWTIKERNDRRAVHLAITNVDTVARAASRR